MKGEGGDRFSVKLRSTKSRAVGSPGREGNDDGGGQFSVKLRSTKSKGAGSAGSNDTREGEMFKVKLKKTKRGENVRAAEDNSAGVPQIAGYRKKKKKK